MHARLLHALAAATTAAVSIAGCTSPGGPEPQGSTATPRARALAGFARVDRVVSSSGTDDQPFLVHGQLGRATAALAGVHDLAVARAALSGALPRIAATFQLREEDLVATSIRHDRRGMTHIGFTQQKHGLQVVGGDLVVHLGSDGVIRSVNSTARDDQDVTAVPAIGATEAADLARNATVDVDVDANPAELVYVRSTADDQLYLAWQVEVIGRDALLDDLVYVDAHLGAVVDRRPQVFTARNRVVNDGLGGVFPFIFNSQQVGTEGHPPSDAAAKGAYDNTGTTYDCYKELFDRDSYDGAGGVLTSMVHVTFFTPNGATPNNAAWAGDQMVYGDGDGNFMGNTSLGFDVTAHELTHGVTSATANLAYENESGALNEAMSDIMAAVCESWRDGAISGNTWLVGEDIFTPATAGDALRYMNDPTADKDLYPKALGGSRDFYADRYTGTEDAGGVHLNSGIANLAFQLLVEGGVHPRQRTTFNVPAIGIEKAAQIFEQALTKGYFTANTTFAQARAATEEVAGEIYSPAEVAAVGFAWAAVGIGEVPPSDNTPPTVAITSPADGATVEAGFAVTATASDNQGVLRVDLAIDGAAAGSDPSAPYEFTTDATLAPGQHTVTATAFDGFNQTSAAITVTISDPGCTTSDDCEGDDVCNDNGECVPPEPPMGCNTNDDCDGTDICEDHVCKPDPGTPGDDDGDPSGGCGCDATTRGDQAAGSLLLLLGVGLVLRRRRPARIRRR